MRSALPSALRPLVLPVAFLLGCHGAGRSSIGEFRLDVPVPDRGPAFANALYQSVGLTMLPGQRIDVVNNGAVFDAIVEEIGRAKQSVNLETFIWTGGEVSRRVTAALTTRAQAGVRCRILVDSLGSLSFGDAEQKPLEAAGCQVRKYRPIPGQDDLARNHRKIVVIDGLVGITGGFGIDDKWLGNGMSDQEWRDSNVRVRGHGALEMQQAFAENWIEAGGELLAPEEFPPADESGPAWGAFVSSTEHSVLTRTDRLTQLFIGAARKRIWIANAYFVPSEPLLQLLERKARAGVEVRILAAGEKTDTKPYLPGQRERMQRLIRAGARAFEYLPAMMHSKVILIDDALVSVGSCNMDPLSLNKMDEGTMMAEDAQLSADLTRRYQADLANSKELSPAQ